MDFNLKILRHWFLKHYKDYIGEFGHNSQKLSELLLIRGIHVRRDELVSVVYSTELNSTTSLASPQRTDRYGILGTLHGPVDSFSTPPGDGRLAT